MYSQSAMKHDSVIEYVESALGAWGETAGLSYPYGCPVFAPARRAIIDGLLRLDRLPRTDPFWKTWANDRATMAKLQEYSSRLLDEEPADETALWLSAALRLFYCDNDF